MLNFIASIFLVLALSLATAVRAQDRSFAYPFMKLVPDGWEIEEEIHGDLNGDDYWDVVLILTERPTGSTEALRRKMLVLAQREDREYDRIGESDRILRCVGCLSMPTGRDGGEPQVTIKDRVIILNQIWQAGGRFTVSGVWRLRYEPKDRRVRLIGLDTVNRDAIGGSGLYESTNYLTGKKIIEYFRLDEQLAKDMPTESRVDTVPVVKRYLEDMEDANSIQFIKDEVGVQTWFCETEYWGSRHFFEIKELDGRLVNFSYRSATIRNGDMCEVTAARGPDPDGEYEYDWLDDEKKDSLIKISRRTPDGEEKLLASIEYEKKNDEYLFRIERIPSYGMCNRTGYMLGFVRIQKYSNECLLILEEKKLDIRDFDLISPDQVPAAGERTYIALGHGVFYGHFENGALRSYDKNAPDTKEVSRKLASRFIAGDMVFGFDEGGVKKGYLIEKSEIYHDQSNGIYEPRIGYKSAAPVIASKGPALIRLAEKKPCEVGKSRYKNATDIIEELYAGKAVEYQLHPPAGCVTFGSEGGEVIQFNVKTTVTESERGDELNTNLVFNFIVRGEELVSMARDLSRESTNRIHPSKNLEILNIVYLDGEEHFMFSVNDNIAFAETTLRPARDFWEVAASRLGRRQHNGNM